MAGPLSMPRVPTAARRAIAALFFREEVVPNACNSLTRLVTLCLVCMRDGAKVRRERAMLARVAELCDADAAPFARAHPQAYSDAVKCVDGVFLPIVDGEPRSSFWLTLSSPLWRFTLNETDGATQVTMSSLLTDLGIAEADADDEDGANKDGEDKGKGEDDRVTALEAKLDKMATLVERLVDAQAARLDTGANEAAAEALRVAQANSQHTSQRATPRSGAGSNPNVIYNLGPAGGGVGPTLNCPDVAPASASDAALVDALKAAGVPPSQIVAVLQSRQSTPAPEPARRRDLWAQATAGTAPLNRFTSMRGETRDRATPRKEVLEVYDSTGSKKKDQVYVWPAADPGHVPLFRVSELGQYWTEGLRAANQRIQSITPAADLALAPVLPEDTTVFMGRLMQCFTMHRPENVLRAWQSAHQHLVDQYIVGDAGRGTWTDMLLSPVFLSSLGPTIDSSLPAAGAQVQPPSEYCLNWNSRTGKTCKDNPIGSCKKRHRCLVCDGEHRLDDCPRRRE